LFHRPIANRPLTLRAKQEHFLDNQFLFVNISAVSVADVFRNPTLSFDSYMLYEDDLPFGGVRLLDTDKRVFLPTGICVRVVRC
jgi:hypothetical protein